MLIFRVFNRDFMKFVTVAVDIHRNNLFRRFFPFIIISGFCVRWLKIFPEKFELVFVPPRISPQRPSGVSRVFRPESLRNCTTGEEEKMCSVSGKQQRVAGGAFWIRRSRNCRLAENAPLAWEGSLDIACLKNSAAGPPPSVSSGWFEFSGASNFD